MEIKVSEITAHAGCVFPHPYQAYANFRPELSLKAEVSLGTEEELAVCMKRLQELAYHAVEKQKEFIMEDLRLKENVRRGLNPDGSGQDISHALTRKPTEKDLNTDIPF